MIEDADRKGYETTCNIMAISNCKESDIKFTLDALADSPVKAVYLVDSYGALYPEEIRRMAAMYLEVMDRVGKSVGIHAHNNQQCAFANTIEALSIGVSYLDGTLSGLGPRRRQLRSGGSDRIPEKSPLSTRSPAALHPEGYPGAEEERLHLGLRHSLPAHRTARSASPHRYRRHQGRRYQLLRILSDAAGSGLIPAADSPLLTAQCRLFKLIFK